MYKMLVVDDEALMREYLKQNIQLLNKSWEVTAEASDGQEALILLQSNKFDLVLTDIKMPVMDGLELVKELSTKHPRQKAVILSGYDEFNFAKEAIRSGVCDYLLKPLVKEELQALLERITSQLDIEKKNETTYNALINLSQDARKQVAKNFLRAVVSDSNIEIKALYPLIHRMKVSPIEAEGIIMLIDINEEDIILKAMPISDISIFRFILNQIVTELLEELGYGIPFFDASGNIVILITGDSKDETANKCLSLYEKIAAIMLESTGITISCATGINVNDVLQLNTSYLKASAAMLSNLPTNGGVFTQYEEIVELNEKTEPIVRALTAMKAAILDNNEAGLYIAIHHYASTIDNYSPQSILRHGVFLIKNLSRLKQEDHADFVYSSLCMLQAQVLCKAENKLKDEFEKIFSNLIRDIFLRQASSARIGNESDIVTRAKEFVCSHYSEAISLAMIADELGITPSYLSDVFHKSVGESYIKYLTRVRMDQAAKLLNLNPPVKIAEVAEKVGYVSVKHFSYVFKQFHCITPGDFQQKYRI